MTYCRKLPPTLASIAEIPAVLRFDVNPAAREAFRLLVPEGNYAMTFTNGIPIESATYGNIDVLSAPLKVTGSDFPELRLVLAAH